jgi:hypothetical protein
VPELPFDVVDEFVAVVGGYEHEVQGQAYLAAVHQPCACCAARRGRDVRVSADHHGVLAPKFECHRHQMLCGAALHVFADLGRTGEEQMVERH